MNATGEITKLSVTGCYALAWRSFSKWWIPLCLISGLVVVFQIVPRVLVRTDMDEFKTTTRACVTALIENDLTALETVTAEAAQRSYALSRKLMAYGLYLFPLIALLTVVLLMYANWAVKDQRQARMPLPALAWIAVVHVLLAIGKLTAFLFFVVPGVYLYIKLLFVSLVMLELKKSAGEAVRISWQMTRGNFWPLLLLMIMNTGLQIVALPTIVGEIPVTGFANTTRAAAFRMLLGPPPPPPPPAG